MEDKSHIDVSERKTRLVVGATFGAAIGLAIGALFIGFNFSTLLLVVAVTLVFAILAVNFGDIFWVHLSKVLRGIARWV